MQRRPAALSLVLITVLTATACTGDKPQAGGCRSNAECDPGEACMTGACLRICSADRDCDSGFICTNDVCRQGTRENTPVITSVDADGTTESDASKVPHRIDSQLTILGEHFDGADARLTLGSQVWPLEVCEAHPDRLVVALPTTLASGAEYTLTVATQAGACSAQLPVLQGEAGAAGAVGATGAVGPAGPRGDAGGGLSLALELDEAGSVSTFLDSSPYGNHAQSSGGVASGSTGHADNAVSFSGGALTVAASNTIPDSPRVTVEAWVQPQLPMNVTRTILLKAGAFALKQVNQDVAFTVTGAASASPCTAQTSGSWLSAGQWASVSGSYDGLSALVYVNGVLRARTSCPNGPLAPSAGTPVYIGGDRSSGSVTEPYAGTIDEVRLWGAANVEPPAFSQIVNVSVFVSNTRRTIAGAASIEFERFSVNKRSPTSYLLIEGTVSGWNDASGSMNQGWRYGAGTEVIAQSLMYAVGPHSKVYPTTAVISGHTTTGPQDLVFRYFTQNGAVGDRPFTTYNPSTTDDPRLGQTNSVYRVWEIEPQI